MCSFESILTITVSTYGNDVFYVNEITAIQPRRRQRRDVDDIMEERAVTRLNLTP